MRRVFVVLCVLWLATIAIAAHAATVNLKAEDVGSVACRGPVVASSSTTSTTTTTTSPSGCQTVTLCGKQPDNQPHNNDNTCDGNNGGGNG